MVGSGQCVFRVCFSNEPFCVVSSFSMEACEDGWVLSFDADLGRLF